MNSSPARRNVLVHGDPIKENKASTKVDDVQTPVKEVVNPHAWSGRHGRSQRGRRCGSRHWRPEVRRRAESTCSQRQVVPMTHRRRRFGSWYSLLHWHHNVNDVLRSSFLTLGLAPPQWVTITVMWVVITTENYNNSRSTVTENSVNPQSEINHNRKL